MVPSSSLLGLRRLFASQRGELSREQILSLPSTPVMSPSYPQGPYHFRNREYFITTYETDAEALRAVVPEPLVPNPDNLVLYEWIKMPDSSGFGSYEESGTVIPCYHKATGEKISFTVQMFLDIEPPIACGREIWGFPKKNAKPLLRVEGDTLVGNLFYAGQEIARGTMTYKHKKMDPITAHKALTGTQCNLKIIPGPDLTKGPQIARLVAYRLQDVEVLEAWEGPARLSLTPHANAAAAQFPIRRIVGGKHLRANLTLPYGFVLHDFLSPHLFSGVTLPASSTTSSTPTDASAAGVSTVHGMGVRKAFTAADVLQAPSMPAICPSYPRKKTEFSDREFLILEYKTTDIDTLRKLVPDLYEIDPEGRIFIQWVKTQGSGLGGYEKVDVHTPVFDASTKKRFNYSLISVSSNSAAITLGREVYGQPHKFGQPTLKVEGDTISATLKYSGQVVAEASMTYNHRRLADSKVKELLGEEELNLKLIPHVDGRPEIAQLVSVKYNDLKIKHAWEGPARLHLIPHVNAPLADLPVGEVTNAYHIVCDMNLINGEVVHDFLKK